MRSPWFKGVALALAIMVPGRSWSQTNLQPVAGSSDASPTVDAAAQTSRAGQSVWSYQFPLPPAGAALTPSVALQYTSGAGNSWVGRGFDLSTMTISRDTTNGPPSFTATDRFVVGSAAGTGEPLMRVGTHPLGVEYRLWTDNADQQFVLRSDNTWIVRTRQGTVHFLSPSIVRDGASGVLSTLSWQLSRTRDHNGSPVGVAAFARARRRLEDS